MKGGEQVFESDISTTELKEVLDLECANVTASV